MVTAGIGKVRIGEGARGGKEDEDEEEWVETGHLGSFAVGKAAGTKAVERRTKSTEGRSVLLSSYAP